MGDIADYYCEQELGGFDLDSDEMDEFISRRSANHKMYERKKSMSTTDSPTITIADIKRVALTTGNDAMTLLQVAEWLESEKAINDGKYVQIRFPGGNYKRYIYECEGCKVDDYVLVPPTPYSSAPQVVRVVEVGRDGAGWNGPVKAALRIPDDFQRLLR